MSDRMSDRVSKYMSDRMSDRMPAYMSDRMPNIMPDRVSECMSNGFFWVEPYTNQDPTLRIVHKQPHR